MATATATANTNGFNPSPVSPISPIHESDARHEPIKLVVSDKIDQVSIVPTLGTPVDPDSIPINPPNGTPPPPTGQLLEDVQMAEQDTVVPPGQIVNGDATAMSVDESVASSAPEPKVNGINGHSADDEILSPDQAEPPTPSPLPVVDVVPRALTPTKTENDLDDDQPPPAKRPKISESDMMNDDNSSSGAAAVASPLQLGPPSSAAPSPPSQLPYIISHAQHRFCLSTVRTLKKLKDAVPFLNPVDPVALGIPHYTNIIKRPMDLSTVERKLLSSNPGKPDLNLIAPRYNNTDEFVADVRLIFENCATFNGTDHIVTQMGRRLEAVFDKQIKQMPPNEEAKPIAVPKPAPPPPAPPAPAKKSGPPQRRASTSVPTIRRSESDQQGRPKREIHPPAPKDLPYADAPRKVRRVKGKKDDGTQEQLRFCGKVLADLHRKSLWDIANFFYEPVDYVKLQIPSYPKIIKKPMDLGTMKKKLESGEYPSAKQFEDDFRLMIKNCFVFNPEGSVVNQAGVMLQKAFVEKWAGLPPLRDPSIDEEEEEEEESDDEQAKAVAAMESQLEFLKGNLAAMKKKPKKEKEKKEKRKDKFSGSGAGSKAQGGKPYQPGKPSKKSKKGAGDDSLSFEQKKDLSETIATLDGTKLERVIQIIHEGVPEIRDSTEEIELDIDSLPTSVLMKLYNFVLRPIRNPPKRSRGVGGGTGGLKRKSMDEDVEAERIRQLEERIALFNGGAASGNAGPSRGAESAHSSDDSSDESSGSDSE